MNIDVAKGLARQIVEHFGKENQEEKLLEELEELKEELKINIGENTITENTISEMADVHILIAQLLLKYDKQEEYIKLLNLSLEELLRESKRGITNRRIYGY